MEQRSVSPGIINEITESKPLDALAPPAPPLEQQICQQFNVKPIRPEVSDFVEQAIKDMGGRELLVGVNDIRLRLKPHAMTAEVQYYQEYVLPGERPTLLPLVTVSARSADGEYGFPNINLMQRAVEFRGNSDDPESRRKITHTPFEEPEEATENRYEVRPEVERYPENAPVRIVVSFSESIDSSYQLIPVFSPAAFDFGCSNALTAARGESNEYSYILDEKIIPAITAYMHKWNPVHYGEKERPALRDDGSTEKGLKEGSKEFKLRVEAPNMEGDIVDHHLSVRLSLDDEGAITTSVRGL